MDKLDELHEKYLAYREDFEHHYSIHNDVVAEHYHKLMDRMSLFMATIEADVLDYVSDNVVVVSDCIDEFVEVEW